MSDPLGIMAYETTQSNTTVERVMNMYKKYNAQFLSLIHVGMDGWVKSLDFVPFSTSHLLDILTSGERADGSSLFKGTGLSTSSSDISLRPRLSSAFVHPFTDEDEPKGLCILCDHLDKYGKFLAQSPSSILKAAHQRVSLECNGLQLYALGEVEYFLGKKDEDSSNSRGGWMTEKGYHSTSPFMFGTKLRRRAMEILTEAGYHAKYGHGEVGFIPPDAILNDSTVWEQHEIEMSLMPLEQAADAVLLCQWIIRNLADQSGFLVSFDPMVQQHHAGNGLHFHMSPTKDGVHLHHYQDGVTNRRGHPSSHHKDLMVEVQAMIAGLCICGGSLMAWGNRCEKSFQRLKQGEEAPSKVQWDFFNRKCLVRLPIQSQDAHGNTKTPATVEFRLGDGSAHPHLLLAGIAQAFVHAYVMQSKALDVVDRCRIVGIQDDTKGSQMTPVPRNAAEVAMALERDRDIYLAGDVFPLSLIEEALESLHAVCVPEKKISSDAEAHSND